MCNGSGIENAAAHSWGKQNGAAKYADSNVTIPFQEMKTQKPILFDFEGRNHNFGGSSGKRIYLCKVRVYSNSTLYVATLRRRVSCVL